MTGNSACFLFRPQTRYLLPVSVPLGEHTLPHDLHRLARRREAVTVADSVDTLLQVYVSLQVHKQEY